MTEYESWTKEALIERLRALEGTKSQQNAPRKSPEQSTADGAASDSEAAAPKRKKRRGTDFDFSRFPQRKVAFKFSYFGWPYHGLARQGNALGDEEKRKIETEYPTVEGELFRALSNCKLITSEAECGYSRCGRTDRGVSGFGQVIALYVRSTGRYLDDGDVCPEGGVVTEDMQNDGRRVLLPTAEKELPYVSMLNKSLPPEIRILAWSPVSADFDARFSCRSRFYRYFFNEEGLDVARMREAAQQYQGTHDFRNFCRLDPAKQISNFERTVLSIDITRVPQSVPFVGDGQAAEGRWWQLELRGTAFLWHQVRCMMSVLFMVGQGIESPDIISKLLDVKSMGGKPEYEMASDTPLVLADCTFDEGAVSWIHVRGGSRDYGNMTVLDRSLLSQWSRLATQTNIAAALLQNLRATKVPAPALEKEQSGSKENSGESRPQVPVEVDSMVLWSECRGGLLQNEFPEGTHAILGGGVVRNVRKYVPMMKRKRAEPVEVRNKAWLERKKAGKFGRDGAEATATAIAEN
ncbi:pseudouridine synthase deg1 [Coemansia sp. Benny D115]|nr:pseudouridine synthase deg1 [Coemansia sp. Benny D115]